MRKIGESRTDAAQEMNFLLGDEGCLRSVMNAARGIVLFLSPDRKIVDVSTQAERLYGRKREELVGTDYLESFVPEDERNGFAHNIRKVLSGEGARDYESEVVAFDGSRRLVSWNIERVIGLHGQAIGVLAAGSDVTDETRMELALKIERDLALQLSATSDLDEALKICVDAAVRASGMDSGGAYLVDEETGDMRQITCCGAGDHGHDTYPAVPATPARACGAEVGGAEPDARSADQPADHHQATRSG